MQELASSAKVTAVQPEVVTLSSMPQKQDKARA